MGEALRLQGVCEQRRVCIWGHGTLLPVHFKEQRREGLHFRETEAGLVVSWVQGNQNV